MVEMGNIRNQVPKKSIVTINPLPLGARFNCIFAPH
jgi:hypothetical protein